MIGACAGTEPPDANGTAVATSKHTLDTQQQRLQSDDFIELAVDKAIADVSTYAHATHWTAQPNALYDLKQHFSVLLCWYHAACTCSSAVVLISRPTQTL
jgi:hypothetical protein